MIDLSQNCIFSGTTDNLNTTMVVKVDGEEYKVAISDEYEDEAVPSKIKKLVVEKASERESKLEQLQRLAEELGYSLSAQELQNQGLVIPQKQEQETPQQEEIEPTPKPKLKKQTKKEQEDLPKMGKYRVQKAPKKDYSNEGLTPEEAEAALEAAKRQAASGEVESPTSREAPQYRSISIPREIEVKDDQGNVVRATRPQNVAQKRQVVKGRAGIPVSIPKDIVSNNGSDIIETNIQVVNTGGDPALQRRFKSLNEMQERGALRDYVVSCRPCKGLGYLGRVKKTCKYCEGTGIEY